MLGTGVGFVATGSAGGGPDPEVRTPAAAFRGSACERLLEMHALEQRVEPRVGTDRIPVRTRFETEDDLAPLLDSAIEPGKGSSGVAHRNMGQSHCAGADTLAR